MLEVGADIQSALDKLAGLDEAITKLKKKSSRAISLGVTATTISNLTKFDSVLSSVLNKLEALAVLRLPSFTITANIPKAAVETQVDTRKAQKDIAAAARSAETGVQLKVGFDATSGISGALKDVQAGLNAAAEKPKVNVGINPVAEDINPSVLKELSSKLGPVVVPLELSATEAQKSLDAFISANSGKSISLNVTTPELAKTQNDVLAVISELSQKSIELGARLEPSSLDGLYRAVQDIQKTVASGATNQGAGFSVQIGTEEITAASNEIKSLSAQAEALGPQITSAVGGAVSTAFQTIADIRTELATLRDTTVEVNIVTPNLEKAKQDVLAVINELRGQSIFFRTYISPSSKTELQNDLRAIRQAVASNVGGGSKGFPIRIDTDRIKEASRSLTGLSARAGSIGDEVASTAGREISTAFEVLDDIALKVDSLKSAKVNILVSAAGAPETVAALGEVLESIGKIRAATPVNIPVSATVNVDLNPVIPEEAALREKAKSISGTIDSLIRTAGRAVSVPLTRDPGEAAAGLKELAEGLGQFAQAKENYLKTGSSGQERINLGITGISTATANAIKETTSALDALNTVFGKAREWQGGNIVFTSNLQEIIDQFNEWAASKKFVYFEFKPRNGPEDFMGGAGGSPTPTPGSPGGGGAAAVADYFSEIKKVVESPSLAAQAGVNIDEAAIKRAEEYRQRVLERLPKRYVGGGGYNAPGLRQIIESLGGTVPKNQSRYSLVEAATKAVKESDVNKWIELGEGLSGLRAMLRDTPQAGQKFKTFLQETQQPNQGPAGSNPYLENLSQYGYSPRRGMVDRELARVVAYKHSAILGGGVPGGPSYEDAINSSILENNKYLSLDKMLGKEAFLNLEDASLTGGLNKIPDIEQIRQAIREFYGLSGSMADSAKGFDKVMESSANSVNTFESKIADAIPATNAFADSVSSATSGIKSVGGGAGGSGGGGAGGGGVGDTPPPPPPPFGPLALAGGGFGRTGGGGFSGGGGGMGGGTGGPNWNFYQSPGRRSQAFGSMDEFSQRLKDAQTRASAEPLFWGDAVSGETNAVSTANAAYADLAKEIEANIAARRLETNLIKTNTELMAQSQLKAATGEALPTAPLGGAPRTYEKDPATGRYRAVFQPNPNKTVYYYDEAGNRLERQAMMGGTLANAYEPGQPAANQFRNKMAVRRTRGGLLNRRRKETERIEELFAEERLGRELKGLVNNRDIPIPARRNLQTRLGKSRRAKFGRIANEALIGGGFPLLFGAGPLSALGGFAGGLGGALALPGGGFAGSVIGSAVGQTLDKFKASTVGLADALKTPTAAMGTLETAGLKLSGALKYNVSALEGAGRIYEAQTALLRGLEEMGGRDFAANFTILANRSEELKSAISELAVTVIDKALPSIIGFTEMITLLAQAASDSGLIDFLGRIATIASTVSGISTIKNMAVDKKGFFEASTQSGKEFVDAVLGTRKSTSAKDRPQFEALSIDTKDQERALDAAIADQRAVLDLRRQGEDLERATIQFRRDQEEAIYGFRRKAADYDRDVTKFRRDLENQIAEKREANERKAAELARGRRQIEIEQFDLMLQGAGRIPMLEGGGRSPLVQAAQEYIRTISEGQADYLLQETNTKLDIAKIQRDSNIFALDISDKIKEFSDRAADYQKEVDKFGYDTELKINELSRQREDYSYAQWERKYRLAKEIADKMAVALESPLGPIDINPSARYSPGNIGQYKYGKEIEAAAKKGDIDPRLFLGLIETESNFRPNARSTEGAVGLAQVLPSTARGEFNLNAYDLKQNLEAGARYLRKMIDMFGSLEAGLRAYNQGPGNQRANPQGSDRESREYPGKVLAAARKYGFINGAAMGAGMGIIGGKTGGIPGAPGSGNSKGAHLHADIPGYSDKELLRVLDMAIEFSGKLSKASQFGISRGGAGHGYNAVDVLTPAGTEFNLRPGYTAKDKGTLSGYGRTIDVYGPGISERGLRLAHLSGVKTGNMLVGASGEMPLPWRPASEVAGPAPPIPQIPGLGAIPRSLPKPDVSDLKNTWKQLDAESQKLAEDALKQAEDRMKVAAAAAATGLKEAQIEVIQGLVQPIIDQKKELEDRNAYEREYGDLIRNGSLPARAEELAQLGEIERAQIKAFDVQRQAVRDAAKLVQSKIDEGSLTEKQLESARKVLELYENMVKELDTGEAAMAGLVAQSRALVEQRNTPYARSEQSLTDYRKRMNELNGPNRKFDTYLQAKGDMAELIDPVNQITNAAENLGNAFGDAFQEIISGSSSAEEAMRKLFASIGASFLDMAAKILAQQLMLSVFQLFGFNKQPMGGFLGSIVGGGPMLGGAVDFLSPAPLIQGFAKGGNPPIGETIWVGEEGPELFTPRTAGTIIPADEIKTTRLNGDTGAGQAEQEPLRPAGAYSSTTQQEPVTARYISIGSYDFIPREELPSIMAQVESRTLSKQSRLMRSDVAYRRRHGF